MARASAFAVVLVAGVPPAAATCGAANCFLVTGTQEGVSERGKFLVDLSYRYVDQGRKREGTHSVGEVLTPKVDFENGVLEPDHHREVLTQNTLVQLDLAWGATDRLTTALSLPLINQRDHEHFDDVGMPSEAFTKSDGASGFGDVRLGMRYALLVRTKNILVGSLAVKLPTGDYRLLDTEGAINEPTIQPGTGSTDLIASLNLSHPIAPERLEWFASGSYRANRENPLEYRVGDETIGSAGVQVAAGERAFWSLQVNARHAERDHFLGEAVPSTGSTIVGLTPGLRYRGDSASFYGFVQVPIYQDVNEAQLAPGIGFLAGVSKEF